MDLQKLYKMLDFPAPLVEQLEEQKKARNYCIPQNIINGILERKTWDTAEKELENFLQDDPFGMKLLLEHLEIACSYSYEEYTKKSIPAEIFVDTFKFLTRFVSENVDSQGRYIYNKGWWFPRQLSLQEFRIGALEFETEELNGEKKVVVHIPSDADMNLDALRKSMKDFGDFAKKYYPEWENTQLGTTTWMLMPELENFLPQNSKILGFKSLFEIDEVDYEQTWYMEWIFPGYTEVNELLPENTTLQKKLKKHLLEGKKFGVATGRVVRSRLV